MLDPDQHPGRRSQSLRLLHDSDHAVNDLVQFCVGYMVGTVRDDRLVRRKEPVRPNPTALVETAGREIGLLERNGVGIESGLTRDLTENHIVTFRNRDYQGRPPLRLAQIGKREAEDYDVTPYKLAQAASSSGVSQSLANADSAASAGITASA